jgi:hypothetical protein
MKWTFKSPSISALPVGYLATTSHPDAYYMLYWNEEKVSAEALISGQRRMLWEKSERLVENRAPLPSCNNPSKDEL